MNADLALVGGGLANSLLAFRLREQRPDLDVVVVERGSTLGGNHVWSFHDTDLTAAQRSWIAPLVTHSWSGHEIRFPHLNRRLAGGYSTIHSETLHRTVADVLGPRAILSSEVRDVGPDRVGLSDGRTIAARAVVDGRGDPGSGALTLAYQKFVGLELELDADHELEAPILMDATVSQIDGFRFVYTLPFARRRLLVEDTRYSDSPDLALEEMRLEIERYASARGWRVARHGREETGVLPIPLDGDIEAFWDSGPAGVPRSGMRAALFHPTTGYSLPEAVRLADALTQRADQTSAELYPWLRSRSRSLWNRARFFRLLNRMLFRAAEPDQRYRVLEKFYRLPESLIGRFYAGRLTLLDRVRIFSGAPPVPLRRALECLVSRSAPLRQG